MTISAFPIETAQSTELSGAEAVSLLEGLNNTNKPLVVTNDDGTRIGYIFQDETYGLVLQAVDNQSNPLPVTLVGSSVVVGSDNTFFKFNGAQEDNFLQLGTPVDIDGVTLFPLNATPLNVEVHSEAFSDQTDKPLTTSYQSITSGVTTKAYQADSSVAQVQFRAVNTSNQAATIQYYITANGAPPTPGDEFEATVPGKSGGDDGVIIISTNDTSTTNVGVGDTVSCEMRIVSGSGVTVTGTTLATTLKITQNTGIQAEVEALNDKIPDIAYCDYSTNPVLLMTTTPTVLDAWTEESTPFGITESNGEFTVNYDGVYNIFLERIYQNDDNNPAEQVTVEIAVEADTGGGWTTIFNRVAPISSATAGDEPAILAFGTPANREVTAGTKFRILVNAQDGGGNPQETYFVRAKVTANLIHKLPA